jgi:hypothetical protein
MKSQWQQQQNAINSMQEQHKRTMQQQQRYADQVRQHQELQRQRYADQVRQHQELQQQQRRRRLEERDIAKQPQRHQFEQQRRTDPFAQVEAEVTRLRTAYQARNISEQDLQAQLASLVVQDDAGIWWTVDINTLGWVRQEGGSWVPDTPPSFSALNSSSQALDEDVLSGQTRSNWTSVKRVILVLTMILALVILSVSAFNLLKRSAMWPLTSSTSTETDALSSSMPSAGADKFILIAEGGGGRILLVDVASKNIVWQQAGLSNPTCVEPLSDDTMLVCEHDRISKIDREGRVIASLQGADKFTLVTDVKPLDNDRILVSDAERKSVSEFDWSGSMLWSVSGFHWPSEAERLPNGNTLIVDGSALLREFDQTGNQVWVANLSNWASAFQRLPNGQTIVGEADRVELLNSDGQIMWSQGGFSSITSAREAFDGSYLLTEPDKGRVFMIASHDGSITWEMKGLNAPSDAKPLP